MQFPTKTGVEPATAEPSDASLIERCRRGDADAFCSLVARYQDRIYNIVYRMVGNRDDAADLCQESFIKAFRAIGSFETRSSFVTWMYRIAANTCISFHRSRAGKAVQVHTSDSDLDFVGGSAEHERSSASDPTDRAAERERTDTVQKAILSLDPESRAVVVLRDIDGKSYEEIADMLDLPIGTVRSRLHRARMELKSRLTPLLRS
ncbi:MAG: sigma-70 family RNA polymerase sigma factor [Planctomycetota bacterium]|nr:sigma-70 family RNA polymerase sigma factor [Planctomycetota bacterium]